MSGNMKNNENECRSIRLDQMTTKERASMAFEMYKEGSLRDT